MSTTEKTAKSKSVLKKILITLGIILAALIIFSVMYVSNYYHADKTAEAALNGSEGVTVTLDSSGKYIFAPAGDDVPNLHTGFIFYPGGKIEYTAYAPLMKKLAKRGITCIVLKMPGNLAILNVNAADGVIADYNNGALAAQSVLAEAAAVNGDDNGTIAAAVEELQPIEHWYIGGHSLGGVAAAMYLAKGHTDEYEGLILLGSYSSTDLSQSDIDVLTIVGEHDGLATPEKLEKYAKNLPANTTGVTIPGGCHAYYGSFGEQQGDGQPSITADEQQEFTADTIAEWLQR